MNTVMIFKRQILTHMIVKIVNWKVLNNCDVGDSFPHRCIIEITRLKMIDQNRKEREGSTLILILSPKMPKLTFTISFFGGHPIFGWPDMCHAVDSGGAWKGTLLS